MGNLEGCILDQRSTSESCDFLREKNIKMPLGIGQYPPEFNHKIHGPYNPARYYGKPDTPFGQVKLGELGSWLSRRRINPVDMARAMGRSYHGWCQKWLLVQKPGFAPVGQFAMALALVWYIQSYSFLKHHRHVKYHW